MKKYLAVGLLSACSVLSPQALAEQGPIVGFDVVALNNGSPNFYYQSPLFSNSAYRFTGLKDNSTGNMTLGLGFRFYIDRYAASPYLEGDILFGNISETRMQVGLDVPMGNLVLGPYVWAGPTTSGAGLNLGFRF